MVNYSVKKNNKKRGGKTSQKAKMDSEPMRYETIVENLEEIIIIIKSYIEENTKKLQALVEPSPSNKYAKLKYVKDKGTLESNLKSDKSKLHSLENKLKEIKKNEKKNKNSLSKIFKNP